MLGKALEQKLADPTFHALDGLILWILKKKLKIAKFLKIVEKILQKFSGGSQKP